MANQPVLVKAFFFLDTDLFQHLSQWEKALMDFYAAHGASLEKLRVLGAGDSELFYLVSKLDKVDIAAEKPVKSEAVADLKKAQTATPTRSAKKVSKPFVSISQAKPRGRVTAGKPLTGKVRKISMGKFSPQGT